MATTNPASASPSPASGGHSDGGEPSPLSFLLTTLSSLTPQPLAPLRVRTSVNIARLDRIEWLELVDPLMNSGEDTTYCTINVFIQSEQSRLPTARFSLKPLLQQSIDTRAKPSRQNPDFSIQRSFTEFKKLRDDTQLAVQQAHGQYCYLCNDFQALLVFTSARPAMAIQSLLPAATSLKQ